jgi:hypothetical protein
MFFRKSETTNIKAALSGIDSVLSERAKVQDAIASAVAQLKPLIEARIDAEAALAAAEVEAVLGSDTRAGGVSSASQRVEKACAAIDKQAAKLAALRGRLTQQGTDLARAHQEISALIPEYVANLRSRFREEWADAVTAFNAAIARRKALEMVVGPMDLSEPGAVAADLGDVSAPHEKLKQISDAIDLMVAWERVAHDEIFTRAMSTPRSYDPRAVYVINDAKGFDSCVEGDLVVDCTYPRGVLRRLVLAGYAVPYTRPEDKEGLTAAEAAQNRIRKEREEEDKARAERERQALLGNMPPFGQVVGYLPPVTRTTSIE